MKTHKLTTKRFKVVDRHTGETVKRYVREGDAIFSAADLCLIWGRKRYIVQPI